MTFVIQATRPTGEVVYYNGKTRTDAVEPFFSADRAKAHTYASAPFAKLAIKGFQRVLSHNPRCIFRGMTFEVSENNP